MLKTYLLQYHKIINYYDDNNYLKALLKLNLAPTIANLKVGTMVNLTNGTRNLKNIWKKNIELYLENMSLSYIELKENKNSVLVLFYNENMLEEIISNKDVKTFLNRYGYSHCITTEDYIQFLKSRFDMSVSCPNEVGKFLGYPLEDVKDFHCSKKCKITGYWRCYNNDRLAVEKFKRYDQEKLKIIKTELDINKIKEPA